LLRRRDQIASFIVPLSGKVGNIQFSAASYSHCAAPGRDDKGEKRTILSGWPTQREVKDFFSNHGWPLFLPHRRRRVDFCISDVSTVQPSGDEGESGLSCFPLFFRAGRILGSGAFLLA
jgi:hypothetical protein